MSMQENAFMRKLNNEQLTATITMYEKSNNDEERSLAEAAKKVLGARKALDKIAESMRRCKMNGLQSP